MPQGLRARKSSIRVAAEAFRNSKKAKVRSAIRAFKESRKTIEKLKENESRAVYAEIHSITKEPLSNLIKRKGKGGKSAEEEYENRRAAYLKKYGNRYSNELNAEETDQLYDEIIARRKKKANELRKVRKN